MNRKYTRAGRPARYKAIVIGCSEEERAAIDHAVAIIARTLPLGALVTPHSFARAAAVAEARRVVAGRPPRDLFVPLPLLRPGKRLLKAIKPPPPLRLKPRR